MGDPIFGEQNNEEENYTNIGDGEANSITLTKEQWQAIETERAEFKTSVTTLTQQLEEQKKMLTQTPTPTPDPANIPNDPSSLSPDDALTLFAKDPGGFTTAVAEGRINAAIAEKLAPVLNPIMQTAHESNLQSERSKFDVKFGVGSFDEIILPGLQKDLDSIAVSNPGAVGDRGTVSALVDRISGTMRTELNDAEAKTEKTRSDAEAAATARVVATLPIGMQPKPEGIAKELPPSAVSLFDSIENATGTRPNEPSFLAVANADSTVDGYVAAMKTLDSKEGTA